VAVTDDEMMRSVLEWGRNEGIFLSPEGAGSMAAYDKLIATGFLKSSDKVVLFNTGTGLKYIDVIADALKIQQNGKAANVPAGAAVKDRQIGGIIGPY
jgi:threonine synthase